MCVFPLADKINCLFQLSSNDDGITVVAFSLRYWRRQQGTAVGGKRSVMPRATEPVQDQGIAAARERIEAEHQMVVAGPSFFCAKETPKRLGWVLVS